MLPFPNRLVKKSDFQKVYSNRKSFFSDGLMLKTAPNLLDQTRIGFSVEKKFFPRATERNIAKRRLREAVRALLKNLEPGFDAVIILRERKVVTDFSKLNEKVRKLFLDSGILK